MAVYATIPIMSGAYQAGTFIAKPDQVGSTDEEVLAIARKLAPVARAAEVQDKLECLAGKLYFMPTHNVLRV